MFRMPYLVASNLPSLAGLARRNQRLSGRSCSNFFAAAGRKKGDAHVISEHLAQVSAKAGRGLDQRYPRRSLLQREGALFFFSRCCSGGLGPSRA